VAQNAGQTFGRSRVLADEVRAHESFDRKSRLRPTLSRGHACDAGCRLDFDQGHVEGALDLVASPCGPELSRQGQVEDAGPHSSDPRLGSRPSPHRGHPNPATISRVSTVLGNLFSWTV